MWNYSEWGLDSHEHASKTDTEEKDCWMKSILPMSLLPFWALNMSVALRSMQGQKALRFHQKYLYLCYEDKRRSYMLRTTWGWVINDRTFIFGWIMTLTVPNCTRGVFPKQWHSTMALSQMELALAVLRTYNGRRVRVSIKSTRP